MAVPAARAPPRVLLQAPGLGRAPRALLLRIATHRTRQAAVREAAAAAAPFGQLHAGAISTIIYPVI
jgi:hypothetical protein